MSQKQMKREKAFHRHGNSCIALGDSSNLTADSSLRDNDEKRGSYRTEGDSHSLTPRKKLHKENTNPIELKDFAAQSASSVFSSRASEAESQ